MTFAPQKMSTFVNRTLTYFALFYGRRADVYLLLLLANRRRLLCLPFRRPSPRAHTAWRVEKNRKFKKPSAGSVHGSRPFMGSYGRFFRMRLQQDAPAFRVPLASSVGRRSRSPSVWNAASVRAVSPADANRPVSL